MFWKTFAISPFVTAVCQTIKLENVTYFSWEIKIGCLRGSSYACLPTGEKELLVQRICLITYPYRLQLHVYEPQDT